MQDLQQLIGGYKHFLDQGKTERECARQIVAAAEKAGYRDVLSVSRLKSGDKVYFNKMGKSIALYHIGTEPIEKGMRILGAHIDSPRLDAKPNPIYEKDEVVYLNTRYYGGIKKYQWLALPLAIHGVIFKKDGTQVDVIIGEKPEDPVFCISDILPHIAQEQMKKAASEFVDGENLDLVLGAFVKKDEGKKKVLDFLAQHLGIEEEDFRSAELEIVPVGQARDSGVLRDMVLAYGQDDRSCSYPSLQALLDQDDAAPAFTSACVLVDKEEVGSFGATGMRGHFFDNATMEVVDRLGGGEFALRRALENSLMISSDVNSAFDPLNASLYDKDNASPLAHGVVFNKYTGGRGKSGASDANPEFIAKLRKMMHEAGVTWQIAELAKVDVGGGGTIAHMAASWGMQVIDCGVPVLSMHAPWELTSKFDIYQAYKAYHAFLQLR